MAQARWSRWSLRARLVGLVALGTALVVGGTTYLRTRVVESAVENETLEAAGATALGIAEHLTELDRLPDDAELDELQADFTRVVPALRAITVTSRTASDEVVIASTDSPPSPAAVSLAREAGRRGELVVSPESADEPLRMVAVPLERDRHAIGAVVATLSMESLQRVRSSMRWTGLLFAFAAIPALTLLIDAFSRRLVLRPLSEIHGTLERATAGDLTARVHLDQQGELGELASGLDRMLERLEGFNSTLRLEVDRATSELRDRNRQLLSSTQKLFAARRDLARGERLASAGQVAASVAHQVGTPLNLISGYVQMILEGLAPDAVESARLRTVQGEIDKVSSIVRGLLDQTRPVLVRRVFPAGELVHAVCELARPTAERAHVDLRAVVEPGLAPIDADEAQLAQAVLNLITNSLEAMEDGGTLTVEARSEGETVELSVDDTGCGISPDHVGAVFDPLFTTKPAGKGTGLGLAIVRDVVAAHGGTVAITSAPARGTRVTVRLPLAHA